MKANNRIPALITLIAVLLWCMACSFYGKVESLCGTVSIRWETDGVSPAELTRQQEYAKQDGADGQPDVTLWEEASIQEISDTGRRSAVASIITVFGNCEKISSAALLSGSYPARSDSTGCAVSSGLAFSLWGGLDVCGMPIQLDGVTFYVRGVFDESENRTFRQASSGSETTLSNMQLKFADGGSRDDADHYLTAVDFSNGTILDLPLIAWSCSTVLNLPLMLLALWIICKLVKRGMMLRHYTILLIKYMPLVILTVCGMALCLELPGIPARLIPTMWSDFDFWKNLFSGYFRNLMTWLSYAPTMRDMELWTAVLAMIFFAMLACVAVMLAAVWAKARSPKTLVMYCCVYMTVFCVASLVVSSIGAIGFNKAMYLMPCLWLCVDFMLWRHNERLWGNAVERNNPDDKETICEGALPPVESEELCAIPPLTEESAEEA